MSKVVAVIPARSGSKGIKHKNIANVAGFPLIYYSIAAALQSSLIDEVYVSTDSSQYAEIAIKYGAKAPFLRPQEIAQDKSSDLDCMLHFLDWHKNNKNFLPEYIVHLRPTTPIRNSKLIDLAIEKILSAQNATALRSVHEMSETAYKSVEIEDNILKTAFFKDNVLDKVNEPRQNFPVTYSPNGYVDILKTDFIINNNSIHGSHVVPFITEPAIEIDNKFDFFHLEFAIKQNPELIQPLISESNYV